MEELFDLKLILSFLDLILSFLGEFYSGMDKTGCLSVCLLDALLVCFALLTCF